MKKQSQRNRCKFWLIIDIISVRLFVENVKRKFKKEHLNYIANLLAAVALYDIVLYNQYQRSETT